MSCPLVTAFFSCSFRPADKILNDYFISVCDSLNISCKNVSDGYTLTPPDVARNMISECKVVIAIIPKREQMSSGLWTMPSAVHEEMAMSYALKKPTLIIVEDGINIDGFISNFGTFICFERDALYTNEFIKKIVRSLHELRLQAVGQNNLLPDQDAAGFYAENISFLIEAACENNVSIWRYTSTRKLVFTRLFDGQIKNSAWVDYLPDGVVDRIHYSCDVLTSREELIPIIQVIKDTPQQLEIGVCFEEKPQKEDWVELEFLYSCPYVNPFDKKNVSDEKKTLIGGRLFDCFDGLIPIQPARDLHFQFRFPSWYPVDKNSIYPFIGSYSGGVDYIVDSEMVRSDIKTNKFGSNTQIDIIVESPLVRHIYGVAWNLI